MVYTCCVTVNALSRTQVSRRAMFHRDQQVEHSLCKCGSHANNTGLDVLLVLHRWFPNTQAVSSFTTCIRYTRGEQQHVRPIPWERRVHDAGPYTLLKSLQTAQASLRVPLSGWATVAISFTRLAVVGNPLLPWTASQKFEISVSAAV